MTVEQRSKVIVLFAETRSASATQRRFRTIFPTRWTPARNTILRGSKSLKRKLVWRNRSVRALRALNKEDNSWVRNVSTLSAKNTSNGFENVPIQNLLVYKLSDNKGTGLQFAAWAEGKDKTRFNTWVLARLNLIWRDCEQTAHAVFGDGTSWERPWREQKQKEGQRLGCHVQPRLNRHDISLWNSKLWTIFACAPERPLAVT